MKRGINVRQNEEVAGDSQKKEDKYCVYTRDKMKKKQNEGNWR